MSKRRNSSKPKKLQVAGRLVVRRVPEANPAAKAGQGTLFEVYRYQAMRAACAGP
ncbi:MAG: hypothetical protein LBG60_11205 [Bifidobacteriaceae bacterium]|jgi:hypothetical protein|nr:hypothetical protein [Bifidobacteriaceae bacterium]